MSTPLYLGIDQGSSATKAVLLNEENEPVFETSVEAPPRREEGRKVEQDSEGILNSVVEAFLECKKHAHQGACTIKAAGIACQRSGVLAWGASDGVPLHPVITWADTRTLPTIQNFGTGVERMSVKTGIPTIPHFAGGKIALLQREFIDPAIHVGTLDTFLLYRMSSRRVFLTEDTMAARTMLYSLHDRNWDAGLCRDFKVDIKRLPRINPSLAPHTTFEQVPILAVIGDQQAALLGRMDTHSRPLLNLGTIAAIMVPTGATPKVSPGIITSVLLSRIVPGGYTREYQYLSEITSAVTGSVLLEPQKRGWCSNIKELDELCQSSFQETPAGRAVAYFVNHRAAPPRKPEGAPNVLITRPESTDADRARAIVENVGNLILRMFDELNEKGYLGTLEGQEIDVAGGGSELTYLLQYLADCTGMIFNQLPEREATARGAALCARISAEGTFDVRPYNQSNPLRKFRSDNPERKRRYLMWQKLENDTLNNTLPPHAYIELAP
jgi:glycerol kinase